MPIHDPAIPDMNPDHYHPPRADLWQDSGDPDGMIWLELRIGDAEDACDEAAIALAYVKDGKWTMSMRQMTRRFVHFTGRWQRALPFSPPA